MMEKAIEIIRNVLENGNYKEDNWTVEIFHDEYFDDEIVIFHENHHTGDEKQVISRNIETACLKEFNKYPRFFFERI